MVIKYNYLDIVSFSRSTEFNQQIELFIVIIAIIENLDCILQLEKINFMWRYVTVWNGLD